MTPNHEIPFTEARPTEEGAYWCRDNSNSIPQLVNVIKAYNGSLWMQDWGIEPSDYLGEWSCKLIPSTALEEAQRRIEELETAINTMVNQLEDLI